MINLCNKIIEYSFYAIFLLVPLAFTSLTSELFELNKMWITWGFTTIIAVSWIIKMIFEGKFFIQKTPLDIPIILFLVSQIISTIFSLDQHVSIWGYYSRFNGGLLSIFSYVFLYYAFVTNLFSKAIVQKLMIISLISGLIVALWGLPSHFGYDPTCFVFRGSFDVACWTEDFLPTVRIFSTLGQPVWLSAYLAILIPIAIAFTIKAIRDKRQAISSSSFFLSPISYFFFLITLFYVDLLYTGSRSGFLGIWFALLLALALYLWIEKNTFEKIKKEKINFFRSSQNLKSPVMVMFFGFLIITFIVGTPFGQLNTFTYGGIRDNLSKLQNSKTETPKETSEAQSQPQDLGGTDSGQIRMHVWKGAIDAWRNNFLFGTGVETFAYAYYKYKPVGQNLTSEWNFLYNKAHNEYLNFLATTGIVGLGTYIGMIIVFFVVCSKYYVASIGKKIHDTSYMLLATALVAGYISILITNFFGFSVVIVNIYLFLIPAFVFVLLEMIKKDPIPQNKPMRINSETSPWQWTPSLFVFIAGLYILFMLFRFWQADIAYALGSNLNKVGEYEQAYQNLLKATELRGGEPVFRDELAINKAIIATSLLAQENSENQEKTEALASSFTQEAINESNEIISKYPNNAVFWKSRVRLFYTLSQTDSRYLPRALDAIQKASLLAPNDANIFYNLGVLYGQNNDFKKGIEALEKTISLKPDYRDARYALGLFYHNLAMNEQETEVIDESLNQKAIDQMQYILDNLNPKDPDALESLENWRL